MKIRVIVKDFVTGEILEISSPIAWPDHNRVCDHLRMSHGQDCYLTWESA